MNNQVIDLPKKHTLKKRLRDRVHDQKSALILSIASVLVLTMVINQLISSSTGRLDSNDRGIASLSNIDIKKNIQWEHELASQVSSENSLAQASLAEKPTLKDDLVFGALQGRYGIKVQSGRVQAIEFLGSRQGDEPIQVQEGRNFLEKYRTVWSKPFASVRPRDLQADQETYQLLDDKMTLVGQAKLKKDSQGRLLSLEFITQ